MMNNSIIGVTYVSFSKIVFAGTCQHIKQKYLDDKVMCNIGIKDPLPTRVGNINIWLSQRITYSFIQVYFKGYLLLKNCEYPVFGVRGVSGVPDI